MPSWSNQLPPTPTHHGYTLKRTPVDRPLKAVATSEDLAVCLTHFWGGRTTPCEKPECPACNAQSPTRAHVYLSALEQATHEHFIFECTSTAALPFAEWLSYHRTLRGCYFTAFRPKRRRNAKVEILCKPIDLAKINLPHPPDLRLAMAVIWQLPGVAIVQHGAINSIPRLHAQAHEIDRMKLSEADAQRAASPSNGRNRNS